MTNYEKVYYSNFYNVRGNLIHVEFHKYYETPPSDLVPSHLRISSIQQILNYHDYFTPIIGAGLEITVQNENEDWNALEDLLVSFNREWYVVVVYYDESDSELIFENIDFDSFTFAGGTIIAYVDKPSGDTSSTQCQSQLLTIEEAGSFEFSCNIESLSGDAPTVVLAGELGGQVSYEYPLSLGINNITIEKTDTGFCYLHIFVRGDSSFTISNIQLNALISTNPIVVFEGFLLPEEQEQQILDYSSVQLKASNQLSQLEELKSPDVDSIQTYYGKSVNRLIAYVAEFLTKTGLSHNIYVNCTLYETTGAKHDLLYDTYLHKHYFADSDLSYDNLYDALNKILLPFNLYVYLWNEAWYIDRIFDYAGPKTFIIYEPEPDSTDDYIYTESTGNAVPVIEHGTDFEYTEMSQVLKYGLGYKSIVLKGVEKENPNLVNETFDDAISKAYNAEASSLIGVWNYDNDGSIEGLYDQVNLNYSSEFRGISTKVLILKTDEIKNFTLSYRRKLNTFEAEDPTLMVYSHFIFNIIEWDHDPDPEQLTYNHETGEWYTVAVDIDGGSEFGVSDVKYDPDGEYYYWEMSLDVPLDEIDGNGWHILEIKLMHCTYRKITDPITGHADNFTDWDPQYCNIRVQQYLNMEDLELAGQISTNYYNRLDQDLPLFDTTNLGAVNMLMVPAKGLLPRLTTLDTIKSNDWTDDRLLSYSSRAGMELQKMFLENMFQQFPKPRKELQATIFYPKPLAPFSIIRDKHILRGGTIVDFVVLGYTWNLNTMMYDITALEIIPDSEYVIEGEI